MAKRTNAPNEEQIEDLVFRRPVHKIEEGALDEEVLLFTFDLGTGICEGFTSCYRKIISFEPIMAPMTEKRDVKFKSDKASKPTFSLREESGQVFVFGVRDVVDHGKYALRRRLTSLDRYTSRDYYRTFEVMLFQAFKMYAGNGEWIRPTGAISVPVAIYDNEETMTKIREAIVGKHTISDMDGCLLRVDISDSRFLIVPESYGQREHRLYDPATLQRRANVDGSGSSIFADIGYETVNEVLYVGSKYTRDASYTLERGGFGVVVRSIQTWAANELKGVDVSRVDIGLRAVAGIPLGQSKLIEVAPGVSIDVQPIYDIEVPLLAERISQDVATRFADQLANRVVLGGGSAHHLYPYVTQDQIGWPVEICPDPEVANPLGVMTKLFREALKRKG